MITSIKITDRKPSGYSDKVELLSFEYAIDGRPLEVWTDYRFPAGMTEDDLRKWLTAV